MLSLTDEVRVMGYHSSNEVESWTRWRSALNCLWAVFLSVDWEEVAVAA